MGSSIKVLVLISIFGIFSIPKVKETMHRVNLAIGGKLEELISPMKEEEIAKRYKDDFWNRPDFWEKEIQWRKQNENKTVDELIKGEMPVDIKVINKDLGQ